MIDARKPSLSFGTYASSDFPIFAEQEEKKKLLYSFLKRAFDIVASFCGLLILLPVFAIVALLIKADDGGPVIHTRICVGYNSRRYKMYKFRTMCVDADNLEKWLTSEQLEQYKTECKLENDPRITKIGKYLRKASIDELPQLMSVLKGDLSLVGPRPVVSHEAESYGEYKELLLSVKAGITGCWQVKGRSNIPFLSDEAKELQLYYATHCSIGLDLKILLQTVLVVLKGTGAK